MQQVRIHVTRGPDAYYATINDCTRYSGRGVDESLGWAVRELWLDGVFDAPLQLTITMDTEEVTP
jgi:hypothetical protein